MNKILNLWQNFAQNFLINEGERGQEELKNMYEIMYLIDGKVSIQDKRFFIY